MLRRDFLKVTGAAAAAQASGKAWGAASSLRKVGFVVDEACTAAGGEPVAQALARLGDCLAKRGVAAETFLSRKTVSVLDVRSAQRLVLVGAPDSVLGRGFPVDSGPRSIESLRIVLGRFQGLPAVFVSGIDVRGLVYGLLELADRVQTMGDPMSALTVATAIEAKPANRVRSMCRSYVSDIEDREWFYDRAFWPAYLDMLAANRFNRFSLTFGLNYDFPKNVTEDYFHFLYPYLFEVPGYEARVAPALAAGEQQHNLETIQFIAKETVKRGLDFQLGLWSHGYVWIDSPQAQHSIEGLTPATHPGYCRDALAMLLKICPEISGLTFRIHEESGIPQGEYGFWQTLFEAVRDCGRRVEIDLHAKSLKQPLMYAAVATGQPLKVSPKFAAEHVALGYQQASIRELEMPKEYTVNRSGKFDLGKGVRGFLRYGYGDLLQEGKPYELLYRVWPGTQRHLLWGDPELAAAWSRAASFGGGAGMEFFEPLAFKGREGSGVAGTRNAYADASLEPEGRDWRKFEYTFRVLGRTLYDPATPSEVWTRFLQRDFRRGAAQVQTALAEASRLLPMVVAAYLPSAANQWYWPELYTHLQVVPGGPAPYYDTPEPLCFGTASPLDPQLFAAAREHASDLLNGRRSAKYNGLEVASWLDVSVRKSMAALASARSVVASARSASFRRLEEDVLILNALGTFFAAKMRAGLLYEIFAQSGDRSAGALAVKELQKARDTWAAMAARAGGVYRLNIAYGDKDDRRGHWLDRLPAIDRDLAMLGAEVSAGMAKRQDASAALAAVASPQRRGRADWHHVAPSLFVPGKDLPLVVQVDAVAEAKSALEVSLHFRHVNQAEKWQSILMSATQATHAAVIPGAYADSPFSLQYYFELRGGDVALLYPGLGERLDNQPYFVVERRKAAGGKKA